jgi:hypothetical protein
MEVRGWEEDQGPAELHRSLLYPSVFITIALRENGTAIKVEK